MYQLNVKSVSEIESLSQPLEKENRTNIWSLQEMGLLNINVKLKQHNKMLAKSYF
jgi:hypothetical protein